jgi:polysaccharide pyruvyl transferase WcaK-like protein
MEEEQNQVSLQESMRSPSQVIEKEKPRKIALFGAFGVGNLGNECTLQALLHNIRRYVPDAEISCICPRPEVTRSDYKIPGSLIKELPLSPVNNRALQLLRRMLVSIPMELLRWLKAIVRLKNVDMLVMTGTGMLGDFGIAPFGLHYEILKWTVAAKLCRCKVLFLSVGAGPLRQALSRRIVKAALACADYRSYRDNFSKDYLKSISFDSERDQVYPDLAFSFPTALLPPNSKHSNGRPVIGVGLMTYFNRHSVLPEDGAAYREYIAKVGSFVAWLLERNYTVRLLIGDVTYDQRARQDLQTLLEERGFSYENGSIIDEPAFSVEDVLSQIAATDLVVASRFHNVLLALMLGRPVLAISYHEKVDALMEEAGLAAFRQDIESINLEKLTGQFVALEEQSDHIRLQLNQKAQACRVALDEQYRRIFDILRT